MTRPDTFTAIVEHFAHTKSPAIFIDGLKIYRAKANSVNAGALYVVARKGEETFNFNRGFETAERTYYGKVLADGTYRPTRDGEYWGVVETLEAVAEGGLEYLARVGRETGNCCFCGLELTDPESVTRGYGPVCASKNGLPHGNRHGF